jgi:hypothetical protein
MGAVENWLAIECPNPDCQESFYRARDLQKHKIVEHGRTGLNFNTEVVLEVVRCGNWQRFRTMMKGLSTSDKLPMCEAYLQGRAGGTACCNKAARLVQIMNYLYALSRGGLIMALSNEEKALLIMDEKIEVRIRR